MLQQSYKSIGLTLSLFIAASASAAVPIEQRTLTNTPMATHAAASADIGSQGSTLWQLYQQVQQLQQEIRELRGQLEGQQYVVDKTQKDLKNRYTDLDQRIELLAQANQEAAATTDASDDGSLDASTDDTTEDNQNNNTAESSNTANAPTNPLANQNDPKNQPDRQAYIGAYEIYKKSGASSAIAPMQQYISNYPNSVFVPNAYYWLGEFYLASQPVDFDKAKQNFQIVVSQYPKSAKAASALYRLANITNTIEHRPQDALNLMRKLTKDYPNTQESSYALAFIKSHS